MPETMMERLCRAACCQRDNGRCLTPSYGCVAHLQRGKVLAILRELESPDGTVLLAGCGATDFMLPKTVGTGPKAHCEEMRLALRAMLRQITGESDADR